MRLMTFMGGPLNGEPIPGDIPIKDFDDIRIQVNGRDQVYNRRTFLVEDEEYMFFVFQGDQ